jgi:hypothetical protein
MVVVTIRLVAMVVPVVVLVDKTLLLELEPLVKVLMAVLLMQVFQQYQVVVVELGQ